MKRTLALILATAQAPAQSEAVSSYTLTSDRLWSIAAGVAALVGVVMGGLALARSADRAGNRKVRMGAIAGLGAGLIAVVISGLVLASADGGPGTGNGVVGAIAALGLGLIDLAAGGLALARYRRYGY